ncbi:hypothetical protein [Amycolatopsis jiangsuensis]|uniref:Uncharacterized protein n=1 Tax=Amycolatopsis jiangsuensis TaxID=1181879 RepID=A0A840IRX0_9PSEU|nr:hypothetical protein [Amycolatopsis jiangsuensis]MBB4685341.1 hypothetical protein [Amycolatopsis jiangsuensis]
MFELPDGWRSVPPGEVGTPEAAFVALNPGAAREGFVANITITGEVRDDDVPLTTVGDEAVDKLRDAGAQGVKLGRRNEVGSAENPGLTQAVRLIAGVNGKQLELVQFQVFLALRDQQEPARRAVLHVVLSALLADQFEHVIDDFQKFLATIEPEQA